MWCDDNWGQQESVMGSLRTYDEDRLGGIHTDEQQEQAYRAGGPGSGRLDTADLP